MQYCAVSGALNNADYSTSTISHSESSNALLHWKRHVIEDFTLIPSCHRCSRWSRSASLANLWKQSNTHIRGASATMTCRNSPTRGKNTVEHNGSSGADLGLLALENNVALHFVPQANCSDRSIQEESSLSNTFLSVSNFLGSNL